MMLKNYLEVSTWLLIFATSIIASATDENLSLNRYLPLGADELDASKRFQQIMQSGSHSEVGWPHSPKLKAKKVDVPAEIAKLNSSYVYQSTWPEANIKLGAVTAVSFDKDGNVVIFHRVDRLWTQRTFDNENVYKERKRGPIRENTILAFERHNGAIVYQWGKNLFYMPHGLTVDHEDNVWLTDVALHQVFKYGRRGLNEKPLMTLGTAFVPGAGDSKFCKPTSVAVLENGDFFVADGYCNARILKYSKSGEKILSWGQNSFAGISYDVAPKNYFAIPHALTLVPEQELVCTADRENGRVQCFFSANGTFHSQYHSPIIGDRLFSMAYTPAAGGQLIVVNGPTAEMGTKANDHNEVRGYVVDMKSKQVISKFGPNDMQFHNPHDVAVTEDGNEIYVAELDPTRVYKFLHKSVAKSMSLSAAKPTATLPGTGPEYEISASLAATSLSSATETETNKTSEAPAIDAGLAGNPTQTHTRPGATAILVASLMLLFAFLTFAMALLIARRRKRGCLPFGVQNRRHAWDFPTKPEGFKLGGLLLDRGKRSGFEKLDQNASDEEHEEATTHMLTGAQFA